MGQSFSKGPSASVEVIPQFLPLGAVRMAASPDGKTIVLISRDHTISIWDWANGVLLRQFSFPLEQSHPDVGFLADGRTLFLAWQFETEFFDFESWESQGDIGIKLIGTFPDSRHILAMRGGGFSIIDWKSEIEIRAFGKRMFRGAVSADGSIVAGARVDGTVHIYNARTGEEISQFQGISPFEPKLGDPQSRKIHNLAVSNDGGEVYCLGFVERQRHAQLRIFEPSGQLLGVIEQDEDNPDLGLETLLPIVPRGVLVTGTTPWLWMDGESRDLPGISYVSCAASLPNNKIVVSSVGCPGVKVIDLTRGQVAASLGSNFSFGGVEAVGAPPLVITWGSGGILDQRGCEVAFWNAREWSITKRVVFPGSVVALSPDGSRVVVENSGLRELGIYRTTTGRIIREIAFMDHIRLMPDGSTIWGIREQYPNVFVVQIDYSTGEHLQQFQVEPIWGEKPNQFKFSPDGAYILYGYRTYAVLYDLKRKAKIWEGEQDDFAVMFTFWSQDCDVFGLPNDNNYEYDLRRSADGSLIQTFNVVQNTEHVALTPDGKTAWFWGDVTLGFVDLGSGNVRELDGWAGGVAFSEDLVYCVGSRLDVRNHRGQVLSSTTQIVSPDFRERTQETFTKWHGGKVTLTSGAAALRMLKWRENGRLTDMT